MFRFQDCLQPDGHGVRKLSTLPSPGTHQFAQWLTRMVLEGHTSRFAKPGLCIVGNRVLAGRSNLVFFAAS